MEIAIIGYEGCEYHMSAIETAHAAGIKAIVKTVPNPEEFQRFLMSIKATTHRTSPIVFDITATTAVSDVNINMESLLGATLIGGCDELKQKLGYATTAEEQQMARQIDTTSRSPDEIASFFHTTQRSHRFVLWVLWRGVWWPPCQQSLRGYNRLLDDVHNAGGEIIGITSAPQSQADTAAKEWGINFPLVSDPSCELVLAMNRNGWINSVVEMDESRTSSESFFVQQIGTQYETGMLQPGVVALQGEIDVYNDKATNEDRKVLVTWGSIPTLDNAKGAAGRLHPRDAWSAVKRSLDGDFSLARPETIQGKIPINPIVFCMMLMANGNFIMPKTFTNDVNTGRGADIKRQSAMRKGFLALGALGFGAVKAPKQTSALLAAYLSYFFLTPGGPGQVLYTTLFAESKAGTSKL